MMQLPEFEELMHKANPGQIDLFEAAFGGGGVKGE